MISLGATVEFVLMRMDFRDMQRTIAATIVKELERFRDANRHLDLHLPPPEAPR